MGLNNVDDKNDDNAGSNENGDPDYTDDQNDLDLLSVVVQSCLDLLSLVGYVHLKP